MRILISRGLAALLALAFPAAFASAATIPFTETFSDGPANWRGNPNSVGSLDGWSASGGAVDGGGYISEGWNFVANTVGDQGPVIFRGPASASGGAFVGNWIAQSVDAVSVYVRHDAPVPINMFARFADPMGFPGAIAVAFAPVLPNQWTQLTFLIDPSNPQFVSFEGQSFETVFDSIGILQFGASTPAALAGVDQVVHFDLDTVAIVPEAGGLSLFALGALALLGRTRRKEA